MKRVMLTILAALLWLLPAAAQGVSVETARFHVGDDMAWLQTGFDDGSWQVLTLDKDWNRQGIRNADGFGWYRLHVVIPSTLKGGVMEQVLLDLGPIDDADETWLNGVLVGKTGRNPEDEGGYEGKWQAPRRYLVDPKLVKWDQENIIAVRVYNGGDPGGFYSRPA